MTGVQTCALPILSEQIKTQLAGEPVVETPIEDPQVELLPAVEYEEGTGELDVTPETQGTSE